MDDDVLDVLVLRSHEDQEDVRVILYTMYDRGVYDIILGDKLVASVGVISPSQSFTPYIVSRKRTNGGRAYLQVYEKEIVVATKDYRYHIPMASMQYSGVS